MKDKLLLHAFHVLPRLTDKGQSHEASTCVHHEHDVLVGSLP